MPQWRSGQLRLFVSEDSQPDVEGTRTIIRLAASSRSKTLIYCSTISVLDGHAGCRVTEETPLMAKQPRGSYAETKWVAERLVEQARQRGLPVVIFRPGRITGDSVTGIPNSSDAAHLLVKNSLDAGILPNLRGASGLTFDMTPVDYASQTMLELAQSPRVLWTLLPFAQSTTSISGLTGDDCP